MKKCNTELMKELKAVQNELEDLIDEASSKIPFATTKAKKKLKKTLTTNHSSLRWKI